MSDATRDDVQAEAASPASASPRDEPRLLGSPPPLAEPSPRAEPTPRAEPDPRGRYRVRPILIGLTGPIGCGKSAVAGWLAELGAATIDADALARDVTLPGEPALEAVIARYGERYRLPDGSLDRAALGRLVFADPDALRDLEAIIHPAVRTRIEQRIAAAGRSGVAAVVIEAIKLVEGGLAERCDEVWLVTCEAAVQRSRLRGRGAGEADADQRIAVQGDIRSRLAAIATRVLETSGSEEATRRLVREAYEAALAAST